MVMVIISLHYLLMTKSYYIINSKYYVKFFVLLIIRLIFSGLVTNNKETKLVTWILSKVLSALNQNNARRIGYSHTPSLST